MAATNPRGIYNKGDLPEPVLKKVGVGTVIPGTLVMSASAGYLLDGADTASCKCEGVAAGGGTATSNGEFEVPVYTEGVFKFKNSGSNALDQSHVGKHAYIEDNETVASTSTNKVRAGIVEAIDVDGVWVNIRSESFKESVDLIGGDDAIPTLPSTDQKAALAGTDGTPDASNKYVTNSDARMTDARAPTAHATEHQAGGGDVLNKPVPSATKELASAFTSGGAAGWEDVDTVDVTLVADGAVFATAHLDLEAAAATAVAPNFRMVIGASNGPTIAVDLLATQDALAAACSHLATGLSAGAITCKLQVQDDGTTAVKVNHAVISAIGLQI